MAGEVWFSIGNLAFGSVWDVLFGIAMVLLAIPCYALAVLVAGYSLGYGPALLLSPWWWLKARLRRA